MTTKIVRLGKYHLLERLHAGSIAEVFVAKAGGVEGFERIVAVKKVLPVMAEDEEFNRLFLDEARIAVQLSHANIVHTLEFGKEDDTFFIVMEYVAGKDVRALLEHFRRSGSPAPVALAAHVLCKLCEGLDYAHRKKDARGQELNIVHRAVAPQNVLISFDGEVKIIDFGMAKAANRLQKTQAGVLRGQAGYMSPEQVRGEPIDRRTDIFAAGVVLYELLTGRKLFQGDNDFSTMELVANASVPQPTGVNPNLPDELEAVLMRALARDPKDRYQYASEFQEALSRFQLAGDSLYTSSQLSGFLKANFEADIKREAAKMERFAGMSVAGPSTGGTGIRRRASLTGMPAVTAGPLPGHDTTAPKGRTDLPFDLPPEDGSQPVDRTVIVSLDSTQAAAAAAGLPGSGEGDGLSQQTQIAALIPTEPPSEPARSRSGSNMRAVSSSSLKAVKLTQAPAVRPRDAGPGLSDATQLANGPSGDITSPGRRPTGLKPKLELPPEPVPDEIDPLEITNPALSFSKAAPAPARPASANGNGNGKRRPAVEVGFGDGQSARTDPNGSALPRQAKASEKPGAEKPGAEKAAPAKAKAGPNRKVLVGAGAGLLAVIGLVLALVLGRGEAGGQGIVVRVTPSDTAKVTLNGRLIPPNRVTHFPPGEYDLVAMAPGYKRHTQRITIFKDDAEAVFDIFLEHEEAEPAVATTGQPAGTKSPGTAPEPKTFAASFQTSEAGVEVLVDGHSVGTTPNAVVADLEVGQKYHFVARKPGFETVEGELHSTSPGQLMVPLAMREVPAKHATGSSAAAATGKPSHTEKRAPKGTGGKLVATTDPSGADTFIDGRAVSKRTPMSIDLPVGKHLVMFQLAGLKSALLTIEVREGETVSLTNVHVDQDNDVF